MDRSGVYQLILRQNPIVADHNWGQVKSEIDLCNGRLTKVDIISTGDVINSTNAHEENMTSL